MNSQELLELLNRACSDGIVAARAVTKLQPVDGQGGKVAPPTFSDGAYAQEERLRDGRKCQTVLLDSVQSQANRLEEALLDAYRAKLLSMPLFEINIPNFGAINSLTAPHRVHDAIFRDSLWNGKLFRESENGKRIIAARVWNATPFFEFAPTVLLFGTWDSQGGGGTNTAKVARSLVSEIVAFDVIRGVRTSSRIDPLGIKAVKDAIVKLEGSPEVWKFQAPPKEKVQDPAKETKPGTKKGPKTVRPSDINHGNIPPSIVGPDGPGGITFSFAEQTSVLSFTQLRKLRFLDAEGKTTPERDAAGQVVIAALGLYALALQWENGFQLRSRCQLVPVEAPKLQLVPRIASDPAAIQSFEIEAETALKALNAAVEKAAEHNLKWHDKQIELQPREDLLKLLELSNKTVEEGE